MGIADRIISSGNRVFGANFSAEGKRLAHLEMRIPGTPYPFLLGLSQKRTEEELEAHLQSLGGTLERGIELEAVEQNDESVSATLASDDGTTETSYITTPGGMLIGFRRSGETYYYHADRMGSIINVTDDTGTVKNTYNYYPFGEELTTTEAAGVEQPYRWHGLYYDGETLHYNVGVR